MRKILLPIILFIVLVSSCSNSGKDELQATVDSFSVAYFNWQFQRALHYTDNQSVRWLSLAASQVNQEDVDSLRSMEDGATVKIIDLDISDDDSSAVTEVEVSNFLSFDSIGKAPHIINKATFHVPALRRNGKWKVALRELPR